MILEPIHSARNPFTVGKETQCGIHVGKLTCCRWLQDMRHDRVLLSVKSRHLLWHFLLDIFEAFRLPIPIPPQLERPVRPVARKLSKDVALGTWTPGFLRQDPRVLMKLAVTLHHATAQGAILRLVVEIT